MRESVGLQTDQIQPFEYQICIILAARLILLNYTQHKDKFVVTSQHKLATHLRELKPQVTNSALVLDDTVECLSGFTQNNCFWATILPLCCMLFYG